MVAIMESQRRYILINELRERACGICKKTNLNEMIMIHEMMLSTFYTRKPLFYKVLFKHHRFYVCSTILAIYYRNKSSATLKQVKHFILKRKNLMSASALNALLIQLRVSGRLETCRRNDNRRESLYSPSTSLLQEAFELIQSMLKPYEILNSTVSLHYARNAENFIPHFLLRYSDYILNYITIVDILPEVALFIEKDAGHMIMLIIYREYVQQNSRCIMLSSKKIAQYGHVSRSHVCNVLREAQEKGYLKIQNNLSILLSEKFISLFRLYFSIYMALVLYATDEKTH
ncbi:hypothetical protein FEM41_22635 [Jejubacter calystegiae]|uniref:Uncharacterized protein n=1 Tax=Jejubacter calystegiae TaxID=2579935 RepID=A0A4P8YQ54_9ENTR|nr:hypothetical protein [Jejubacter calystegiae]QCT22246.1 hypothetical protein FEM41_22635 [Jejubacter calystegiae]